MDVQPCGIGRRRLLGGMGAAALAGAAPAQAWSQPAYPDKPIRLLMPLTPGGAADTNMRLMATKMTLGQPFVIDNRPGGSGSVAVQLAKNAPADGYTLLMTHPGMLSAQVLLKLYDLLDLFQPITMAGEGRLTLIVPPKSPLRKLDQLLSKARAEPGKLNYGSIGIGTLEHLLAESLNAEARIQTTHIPYKGGPDLIQALVGGQIDFCFMFTQLAAGFVEKGMAHPLASLSAERQAALPQVPTFAELKLPLHTIGFWGGLCAPKGTPAPIVQRLYTEFVAALKDPEVQAKMRAGGTEPVYSASPAEFTRRMEADIAWARQVITSRKITAS